MSDARPSGEHGDAGDVPDGADDRGRADVVVIGAGPAGLTAALQLSRAGRGCVVLEADDVVGGISRTVVADGRRFDIGGHRFFTKVAVVEALWREILPEADLLTRRRSSRIHYRGRFFDYPVRPLAALRGLGPREALPCVASYLRARVAWWRRTPETLEDYVVANYGRRLYDHFFRAYTEKVWGVAPSELSADWGAQRIKGMSLWAAVWEPVRARLLGRRGRHEQVTSLIEEFRYPRLGPGMMWERCAELVEAHGNKVALRSTVTRIDHRDGRVLGVVATDESGATTAYPADRVVSSMPLATLVRVVDPPPPAEVLDAAAGLRFRDFLCVAVVVPAEAVDWTDNWIYVHDPEVEVMRIQNFGAWSPEMVTPGDAVLGLEYTTERGSVAWEADDDDLVARAVDELDRLGLVRGDRVTAGYVVRMPKAYPVYDDGYADRVGVIRDWLATALPGVHPVGRNGMHRYNNQDHSMLTAMLAVENVLDDAGHDVWAVNVDDHYHEDGALRSDPSDPPRSGSTGRDAPIVPRRR